MTDDANILAALERIVMQLEALPRAIVAAQRERGTASADDAALGELLTAIAATTQGRSFSVNELMLHSEVIAARAADQRLHDAIVGACSAINGRQLGKLLARLEGRELDGRRVVRVGSGRDGITWRIAGFAS